jgi:hypothetical protein
MAAQADSGGGEQGLRICDGRRFVRGATGQAAWPAGSMAHLFLSGGPTTQRHLREVIPRTRDRIVTLKACPRLSTFLVDDIRIELRGIRIFDSDRVMAPQPVTSPGSG